MARLTRRQVLKSTAVAAAVTTSPWWLVKTSHAQRAKKLVFWHVPNFTPLADDLQKQQVYEFAKQAGLKENDVEYATGVQPVRDLRARLKPHGGQPAVADLTDQLLPVS